jgi:peptide/nickel transport system ATP-binding protein
MSMAEPTAAAADQPGNAVPGAAGPLLRVEDLAVTFRHQRGGVVQAVSGITFDVAAGETLGLVGESGCGKSTTAKAIMRLVRPSGGRIIFDGVGIHDLRPRELRRLRPSFQLVAQDPAAAVNPLRTVRRVLEEPLRVWRREAASTWDGQVSQMLEAVGLDPAAVADRQPHELSGGQLQRVCVARAIMLQPKLLVADEPIASLDVSIQAQILNLLLDLRERLGLAMLLIAHDLAAVRAVSDRVAIMYLGKLCEIGPVGDIYDSPAHPYTRALLASVPRMSERGVVPAQLAGDVPSPLDPPSGCRFRTRCPLATELCAEQEPVLREIEPGRRVACHYADGPAVPAGVAAASEES